MTIHSDWLQLMKTTCPAAFTKAVPFTPSLAFIDGQIKLMAMCRPQPGSAPTWECFLTRQFVRPIENHWRSHSHTPHPTVVRTARPIEVVNTNRPDRKCTEPSAHPCATKPASIR